MTAVGVCVTTTCPLCLGGGEEGYEPVDWWHGSGVNVITWPCRLCKGECHVTHDRIAEWNASEPDGPDEP